MDTIVRHIRENVSADPYLLIAYAWTFYMAIFSGGRWIRSQLCNAGDDFWQDNYTRPKDISAAPAKKGWNWRSPVRRLDATPTSPAPKHSKPQDVDELRAFETKGLSLWFFPGPQDGEEIRTEFKARLQLCEALLSSEQREEIVAESQSIFSRIEAVVAELDGLMAAGSGKVDEPTAGAEVDAGSSEQDSAEKDREAEAPGAEVDDTQAASSDQAAVPALKVRRKKQADIDGLWFDLPGYAGLALVISCVSWYALYHSGTFS